MSNPQGTQVGRTIALPPEMDADLTEAAKERGISVSMLIRGWIQWQLQARRLKKVNSLVHSKAPETLEANAIP